MELPPGFRFHPTDEELITHYLSPKVLSSTFSSPAIAEVDLNKCEPWDLPGRAKMGEKEWYFYCVRDRKYPTGLRTNRATAAGYWKATGKDKEILKGRNNDNNIVGMKKTLVFYKGRAPRGHKSNWVMHEYRLHSNNHSSSSSSSSPPPYSQHHLLPTSSSSQPLKSPAQKFEGVKFIRRQGPKMQLTLTQPDDWHLHLRDGDLLKAVLPHSASTFGRAIVMPNLKPPITTTAAAVAYRDSILKALPSNSNFIPLMTLYLTDTMSPNEIKLARKSGAVYAVKLYPAGATTNSQDGVTDLFGKCLPVLEEMVEQDMPLLVHGEVTNPDVDMFDREKVFIETVLKPLIERLPKLKVVMEHITTANAAKFVLSCEHALLAATVTPQHLLLNRNSLFQGGLQPHNYCLPVLKRETHRQAIVSAVTSGSKKFFLGTDSAPHERRRKESSCGCAGIYSAPIALSLYAKVFEEAGALDKLEAFTSFNGPDFYGLPRNTSKITLQKAPWQVPKSFTFPFGDIVPMFAGETLEWQPCFNSD